MKAKIKLQSSSQESNSDKITSDSPNNSADVTATNLSSKDKNNLSEILNLLCHRKGTDFTYYKQTTILRRIERRIKLLKKTSISDYLKFLKDATEEQDKLYQDLLIPVSSFFRDPKSFDYLCRYTFPKIAENKTADAPIRIWIAGCSTGQEAYSMAICVMELLGKNHSKFQVFATDISALAIKKARSAEYTKKEVEMVSTERLTHFFKKTTNGYQVVQSVRDLCVFAVHDFLKDPPFSKMDLISCRNVLIYMESSLQKNAFTAFHRGLNPGGFLFLGKSETTDGKLFSVLSKNEKLFLRKDMPSKLMHVTMDHQELALNTNLMSPKKNNTIPDFQKTADDMMLNKYTPAAVVVNEVLDIVHFRGNTHDFLQQMPGKPSHNLLKMAREGLSFELRNMMKQVSKKKSAVIKENIPFQLRDLLCMISIEVVPLPDTVDPHYLILFRLDNTVSKSPSVRKILPANKNNKDLLIEQLSAELQLFRDDMNIITQDQDAVNEELQSANEELQSLNEELETNKEELQSTNEELTTVNNEMQSLNLHIMEARDYAEAIVLTIHEPMLILDKHLRVTFANNSFYQNFRVTKQDTQGILLYDLGNKQWDIPGLRKLLEDIIPQKSSFHNFELAHHFPAVGDKILLLNANRIVQKSKGEELILLAIHDVTEIRAKIVELQRKEKELLKKDISERTTEKIKLEKAIRERTHELEEANKKLVVQNEEKEKRAEELVIANKELIFQNEEKGKRALEAMIANKELVFQNKEKGKREAELVIANKELVFQNTEKGKREAELAIANTELIFQNSEKGKRAAELAIANEELLYQNEEKEKRANELALTNKELQSFGYVASHDLQEPLRKIQTIANRILEKENENLSESGKDYFRRMQSAAARMQRLIEDILAFSRINTTERIFKKTSLNKIVEDVREEFRDLIEEKAAILEISELHHANIIEFQFRQLLHNLIGNALKFSQIGIPPYITIQSGRIPGALLKTENISLPSGSVIHEKDYYHLSISDNGIGFEPHFKDHIFEVFKKLHRKEEYAGTGIGLSIVKKIVENHNGIITASGEYLKGARFDIYLPESYDS